ncbi:MAG: M60 family metallopeptidase [Planctomycetota bacterium]
MINRRVILPVTLLILSVQISFAGEKDLAMLLDGVKCIDAPGVPGPVCVFGDGAFAVVVGKTKSGAALPVMAASRFGRGRVVAFGKGEFLSPEAFALGDTGLAVANAARWASGKTSDIRVGVHQCKGIVPALTARGLNAREVSLAEMCSVDVLLIHVSRVQGEDIDRLSKFVSNGGGIMVGELGWGWLQLHPGKSLSRDFLPNRLLAPMGIVWSDGTLDRTGKSGYVAEAAPSHLINAAAALGAALAHADGKRKLTKAEIAQVSTVLPQTAFALPPDDAILLPRIRKLMDNPSLNLVPTEEKPIQEDDFLPRLVLTMQTREVMECPAEAVKAHPAAAVFPGSVAPDAKRVERTVDVDAAIPLWHSTGLYAAPGEVVTVTVPPSAAGKGLKVRIGSSHCKNWSQPKWFRAPEITREFAVQGPITRAANAFGGLIYIVAPENCKLGAIKATIAGGVEAPYFVLGKTTPAEWRTIRQRPAPWAEIASNKAILTVPSDEARKLDNPAAILDVWHRILDACAELAAWPSPERERPERYVADVQLCSGYMHAGYPIAIPVNAAPKLLDPDHLLKEGNWGLFHETGHNHQSPDWTFQGATEVTVNLFTLYVFDKLCGMDPAKGRMAEPRLRKEVSAYFDRGHNFDEWKQKPFVALMMYLQMQQAFGWDAFKKVFTEYRDLPARERPKTDAEKRDQWMVRFSRTAGKNLGPFFEAWGVPTSEQARASIRDLAEWMPPSLTEP